MRLYTHLTIVACLVVIAGAVGHQALSPPGDPRVAAGDVNEPVAAPTTSNEVTWASEDVAVANPYREDGSQAAARTEPTVAINPADPDNVIAGAIDFDYAQPGPPCCTRGWWSLGRYVSDDGGSTWTNAGFAELLDRDGRPLACAEATGADPSVTFDGSGVAYYSYIAYGCPAPGSLAVQTSADGGHTWSRGFVVQGSGDEVAPNVCADIDKPHVGADRAKGIVYLTWSNVLYECDATDNPPELGWAIYFSKTTDGGATWSDPAPVSAVLRDGAQGSLPRVGPDGTVYVAYYHQAPFEIGDCPSVVRLMDGSGLYTTEMLVARSADEGATWSHHVVAKICDSQFATPDYPLAIGNALALPGLAVDQAVGTVYLTWSDRRVPTPSVMVTTSADRGQTWSEPLVIEARGRGGFIPWIAHADGAAHLVYLAETVTGTYDVLHQSSVDGVTWSAPFTLNTAPLCACWGLVNGPYRNTPHIGHYMGMDAGGGKVIPIWPDTRDPLVTQTVYARVGSYGGT